MKKFTTLLITFIMMFSILLFKDVKEVKAYQEELKESGHGALTAYAYELRLIKYEKKGDTPKAVGNSILVYHEDIFDDIIGYMINSGGKLPGSFDDMYNGESYDVSQTQTQPTGITTDVGAGGRAQTESVPSSSYGEGEPGAPTAVDTVDVTPSQGDALGGAVETSVYRFTWIGYGAITYTKQREKTPASGKNSKINEKLYRYTCSAKKANYYGEDVVTTDSEGNSLWGKMIEDNNLTKDNIENKDYLRTLMVSYASSRQKIKDNFGYDIGDMEIHKYYIQAVPVHRVVSEDELESIGSFVVKNLTKDVRDGQAWPGDTDWYKDGTDCDCPANRTCDENCKYSYSYCPSEYQQYENCKTCETDEDEKTVCTNHKVTVTGKGTVVQLYSLSAASGYRIRHTIYGTLMKGPSYLKTAQQSGKYLERAVNACGTSDSHHCIYNTDGTTCSNKYEDYIGPNKENALVGIGSEYPYQLIGDCNKGVGYEGYKHLYVPAIISKDCKQEICSTICPPNDSNYSSCIRSDDYLKCAENYCEAMVDYDLFEQNARNKKKSCMIANCEYRYGRDPNTKSKDMNNANLQSIDSCSNSKIDGVASKYGTTDIKDFTSTCNVSPYIDNSGHYIPTGSVEGKYVSDCMGESVTDFDDNDTNDEGFDRRTYINVICKEVSSFNFKDISKEKIFAGGGFTYPTEQRGSTECTYFVNLEQWKFDYATIPARDTEHQRDRLKLIIDNYNDESQKSSQDEEHWTSGIKAISGQLSGEGSTKFDGFSYNFAKTTISVSNEEYKVGETTANKTAKKTIVEKSSPLAVDDETKKSASSALQATKAGDQDYDVLYMVTGSGVTTKNVHRYISQSNGVQTYTLQKVCIKTDGTAEVYDAPDNNECYSTKVGEDTQVMYGSSKHFTSFQLKPNEDNYMKATVGVTETGGESTKYYNVTDECTYKISDGKDDGKSCKIIIDTNSDDDIKLGERTYIADDLSARIVLYNIRSSEIERMVISDNENELTPNENYKVTIVNHNSRSVETHDVRGIVYLKNGTTVPCPETVDLLTPGCESVSCDIKATDDKKIYKMTTSGPVKNYYTFTTYHEIPNLDILYAKNSVPYPYMKPIVKSLNDAGTAGSEIYIRLDKELEDNEKIIGYVTSSSLACNDYCYKGVETTKRDCYKEFERADFLGIYQYCVADKNWSTDVNGFHDEIDCYEKCAKPCDVDPEDYDEVVKFCDGQYNQLGFDYKENCVNTCYDPGSSDEYLFRTVNVSDPFPNSIESVAPYEKGERIVGKNWAGLSGYIVSDDGDQTTVTGQNANNGQVEYIIDLTPGDISNIRNDTINKGIGYSNKRKVYAQLDRVKSSSTAAINEYKSKFIHEEFTDLFKSNHGAQLSAVYPKE